MLDLMLWKYRQDNNCWDYVRYFLVSKFGVPSEDVPKYGILPSDKRRMTSAAKEVEASFYESPPVDGAIACRWRGRLLEHVGLVYKGAVYHVKDGSGVMIHPIDQFGNRVKFYAHKSL